MRLIDTHCHINFDSYDGDRDEVIVRAGEAGVTRIINPAVDLETSNAALNMATQYPGMFAAVYESALRVSRPAVEHPG